jgi:hypothetical protein
MPDGVLLSLYVGGGHGPMMRRKCAGKLLYACIHGQISLILLGPGTLILVKGKKVDTSHFKPGELLHKDFAFWDVLSRR